MQAFEAYYNNGRFIPLGLGKIPEGTRAIVTLLNEAPQDIDKRLKDFDALVAAIHAAADEEMPPIERIKFREVNL
ncbi:MAG: DUF104 domain-containing protein [Oscillospiraceae bacterium]|nr:DUF104 domain-containing protein [Oscillospiraceae bacterium]